jgi:ketosteroid isomerase-like protein
MKHVLAAVLLVVSCAAVAIAQPKPAASVSQALTDMERQWATASKASNGAGVGAFLAEDFISLDSDGTMHTKAEIVARTSKSKWTVNEIGDLKVTVHGDSAIVTGSWTGNGTDATGKAVNSRERWADTWVNANGKWLCVASTGVLAPK